MNNPADTYPTDTYPAERPRLAAVASPPPEFFRGLTAATVGDAMAAWTMRELAAVEAYEQRAASAPVAAASATESGTAPDASPPSLRRALAPSSASPVLSVRLGPDELDALRRRAQVVGLAPSVMARNLIRVGLAPRLGEAEFGATLHRIDEAVAALRAARPAR